MDGYACISPIRSAGLLVSLLVVPLIGIGVRAEQKSRGDVNAEEVTRSYFAKLPNRRPRDLISQSDVQHVYALFKSRGWRVPGETGVLDDVLGDGEPLVRTLRSPDGLKFMHKVSGDTLIYDRLDRISRESGGAQLIHDLVKLPDGEKYAKIKTARGVPDLLDLLPKDRSGKRRTIKDYERPTGRIYTVDQLVERLNAEVQTINLPHNESDRRGGKGSANSTGRN